MAGLTTLLSSIEKRSVDLYAVQLADKEIVFRLPSAKRAKQYELLLSMSDLESERMIIYEDNNYQFISEIQCITGTIIAISPPPM